MAGENYTYIKGSSGTMSVWIESESAYKPVVCLTDSSHDLTINTLDVVNMCTNGQTISMPDNISETVSINGQIVDTTAVGGVSPGVTADELKQMARDQVQSGVGNVFRLSRGTTGYIYFTGVLSNVSDNYAEGIATFSASLTIQGAPSSVDPKQ